MGAIGRDPAVALPSSLARAGCAGQRVAFLVRATARVIVLALASAASWAASGGRPSWSNHQG